MALSSKSLNKTTGKKRTVLIGIDQSHFADLAFDFYVKYIHQKGDEIVLVHVSEYTSLVKAPTVLTDPFVVKELVKEEEEKVQNLIEKYSKKMKLLQIGAKVKQMSGKVGEAIILAAKEEEASLIVLGSRGMGTLRRTLLGSVSDYVLHHANVPVLVCRH